MYARILYIICTSVCLPACLSVFLSVCNVCINACGAVVYCQKCTAKTLQPDLEITLYLDRPGDHPLPRVLDEKYEI